jgi:D-3-phosphoglycerate dehydrogenase
MPKPSVDVVVVGANFPNLRPEQEILGPMGVRIVNAGGLDHAEILACCHNAVGILTDYFPWDREAIGILRSCRVICQYGVGLDQIDLSAATAAGIVVSHTPDYCVDEVAEHAVALLLAVARNVARYDRSVRRGVWDYNAGSPMQRMAGKTLGLIGFGQVGRGVARRALGLGLRVLAVDPYHHDESIRQAGAEPTALPDLLMRADFVSIHAPLTEATRGIIGREQLSLMKRGAILINTARGPLVEQSALVDALANGQIRGAGLDVLDQEPPAADEPLLRFDNVVLTPHAAFLSEESLFAVQRDAALEVRRVLLGETPLHAVNGARASAYVPDREAITGSRETIG